MRRARRRVVGQISHHLVGHVIPCLFPDAALVRPPATRMQQIPQRTKAVVAAGAWIMIAKAVEQPVPDWLESRNEQAFGQGYPDIIDCEVANPKIGYRQAATSGFRRHDAVAMIGDAIVKRASNRARRQAGAATRAGRDRLADINRPPGLVRVLPGERGVGGERAIINSGFVSRPFMRAIRRLGSPGDRVSAIVPKIRA